MVERITGPTPPVSLRHGAGRLPDGRPQPYGVPQPPHPVSGGMSRSEAIGWTLAGVIALALLVAGIAGWLR